MRKSCILVAVWVWAPIVQSGEPNSDNMIEVREPAEGRDEALESVRSSLEFGKKWLKDRSDGEFLKCDLSEFGGGTALDLFWIIRDDARPRIRKYPKYPVELEPDVELEVRVAAAQTPQQDDLVEFRWQHEGRGIRVVASVNAFKIDFDLNQLSRCHRGVRGIACVAEARAWVERVLKLEGKQPAAGSSVQYTVALPWPNELADGIWFSSSPEQNIMQLRGWPQWFDRVDAFVEDEVLSILIYKSIGQLMSSFRDGSKWFPDEFRHRILNSGKE